MQVAFKFDNKRTENSMRETITLLYIVSVQSFGVLMLRPYNLRFHTRLETQTVDVINPTNDVLAIKSKCSDNNIYSVDPVYFLLNPGEELTVNVRRESKLFKVDKLVFAVLKVIFLVFFICVSSFFCTIKN